jgi:hypothetical protein
MDPISVSGRYNFPSKVTLYGSFLLILPVEKSLE